MGRDTNVCSLPKGAQDRICAAIREYYLKLGYAESDATEMGNRARYMTAWSLSEILDIEDYL